LGLATKNSGTGVNCGHFGRFFINQLLRLWFSDIMKNKISLDLFFCTAKKVKGVTMKRKKVAVIFGGAPVNILFH